MKTRKIKGGGMTIYQLIGLGIVITWSKNTAWWNGTKHGWRLSFKKRSQTAL